MKSIIVRMLAGSVVLGLGLYSPGLPVVWAAPGDDVKITEARVVEIKEVLSKDPDLARNPELRDIVSGEMKRVEAAVTNPEKAPPEAKQTLENVKVAAVAVAETKKAAMEALKNTDSITKNVADALVKNGVSADKAAGVETQMKDTLAKAADLIQKGNFDGAAKYFEASQKAITEQLGGKDLREVFAAASGQNGGADRSSMEFMRAAMSNNGDVMKAHFETTFKEVAVRGMGPEGKGNGGGPSPEVMKQISEKMVAAGVDPRAVAEHMASEFHGSPGDKGPMGDMKQTMDKGGLDKFFKEIAAAHGADFSRRAVESAYRGGGDLKTPQYQKQDQILSLQTQKLEKKLDRHYTDGHRFCEDVKPAPPPGQRWAHKENIPEGSPGHCYLVKK